MDQASSSSSMKEDKKPSTGPVTVDDNEEREAIEIALFQVPECYVYLIPPRKSAASYRADEWDVNKWAWEGALKVVSKGEECIIKLVDKTTGELYAQAFLREGDLHPVEAVIDSSRYFVLRVEEKIDGRVRHAFIGIGFRERTEAYDFQAALHDHMKYLNKKKTAEEMEQHFQNTSSVDYSLKEGETIVLQLKNRSDKDTKSKMVEKNFSNLSLEDKGKSIETIPSIIPPPPPPGPLSPVTTAQKSPSSLPPSLSLQISPKQQDVDTKHEEEMKEDQEARDGGVEGDAPDDDFGDFQAAG
ncbi:PREDICTED: NECAP-like protein CG9132 [Camelina sativa]|uniref:NECAP-like protein CG9132 n=1 Tax=Camelina sativa TaxID=90675 RepID=A0ABM0YRG4_CAMSA|nr:PREDICTED: NECAP-like protein CG9132 [Camelina sativa]